MNKLLISLVLTGVAVVCYYVGFSFSTHNTVPNNQYQLYVYPEKIVLKDGERTVSERSFPDDNWLDSAILRDNQ